MTCRMWYAQRHGGALGQLEQDAAAKDCDARSDTIIDLRGRSGRSFLTVTQNRFQRNDNLIEEQYATRAVFDIEGSQREVLDAKDRIVMRYDYDMLGTRIHQASMEAGERWMLNDVTGQPIYAWTAEIIIFRNDISSIAPAHRIVSER